MYYMCHRLLLALDYRDDPQCWLSTAMLALDCRDHDGALSGRRFLLVAAAFFGGHLALARRFLVRHGYFRYFQ